MVVYDGTGASELLHRQLCQRLEAERIKAQVSRFDIRRDSASGLCSGSGIREFRGSIQHLAENIGDATMLLVHLAPVSREGLEAGASLRFVGSERSSVVNIDVAEAARRGIRVCYAPGRNARTVAEFTVGLLLAATRSIASSSALVHAGGWSRELDRAPYTGVELEGKRLGLVGFGGIGRQVAQLVRGFGMDVCYYDPYPVQGQEPARPVGLDELLSTSDFISVHARAEEGGQPGYVKVYFPEVAGIPEGFDGLRAIIEEILPSHVDVTYVFWYNTWAMAAERHPTWGHAQDAGLSWYGAATENDGELGWP